MKQQRKMPEQNVLNGTRAETMKKVNKQTTSLESITAKQNTTMEESLAQKQNQEVCLITCFKMGNFLAL